MKLLFTRNNLPLSALICWGFEEPCSHFAIELYKGQVVFQSNMRGCDFQAAKTFRAHNTIVYEIHIPMSQEEEDVIFDNIVNTMVGNKYDIKALAYFAWRGCLYKFLGLEVPKKNKWQTKNEDICVEAARSLPDSVVPREIKELDLSMKRPYQLYLMLFMFHTEKRVMIL